MFLFSLIAGVILSGMVIDAAIFTARNGKVNLSRGYYLIIGLALAVPSMGAPLALVQELRNPNPKIQTFSVPLAICFALGCSLILRFFIMKQTKAEQCHGANALPRADHD